jgi:uncharacterized cupredoxin-like copper-binding protein
MKYRFLCLITAAASLGAPVAWAHGEAQPGAQAGSSVREQTPWGIAGDARTARRTIEVRMTDDMRFKPDRIQVREGETVRFVVLNDGKILHEMVIGTKETLEEHAALMAKFPGMEHDEPYMTHVKPGKEPGVIIWNFNRVGQFQFACLIPGHYEAGMVGTIHVTPASKPTQRK